MGPGYEGSQQIISLAGFGKYLRRDRLTRKTICMTNGHGNSKYHYCSQQGDQVCETRVPPPQSENCQKFLDSEQSKKELGPDSDVAIMSNGTTSMCYVDRGSNYGWCSVYEDAAHMKSFRYYKGTVWM